MTFQFGLGSEKSGKAHRKCLRLSQLRKKFPSHILSSVPSLVAAAHCQEEAKLMHEARRDITQQCPSRIL